MTIINYINFEYLSVHINLFSLTSFSINYLCKLPILFFYLQNIIEGLSTRIMKNPIVFR